MPFGAVITDENGKIVGQGANKVIQNNDPSAHAEIVAIRQACENLRTFKLEECTLYTSCEPCLMCFGAIHWSGLRKVFYAANKLDASESGFTDKNMCEEFSKENKERSLKFLEISSNQKLAPFKAWDDCDVGY
jgi:guanine deaminase